MVKVKKVVPAELGIDALKSKLKTVKKRKNTIKEKAIGAVKKAKGLLKTTKRSDNKSRRVRFAEDQVQEPSPDVSEDEEDVEEYDFDLGEEDGRLAFADPIYDEDDADIAEEERQFLEKSRKGESFPIVSQPLDEGDDDDDEADEAIDAKHKKSLTKLQEKDPEFYSFLAENESDLLEFEGGNDDEEESDDDGEQRQKGQKQIKVTETLIEKWSESLRDKADKETIRTVVEVFRAAVKQASGDDSDGMYKVEGSETFNSIVRLCFVDLLPALHKFLHLPEPTATPKDGAKSINPSKSNNWKKLASPIKSYLNYVVKVLDVVSEDSVLTKLLRHCLYLVPFISCFLPISKRFLIKVTQLWSEGEEKVRVLSFLCILRLMRDQEPVVLNYILKKLYLSYAKNCKQTSHETWPLINFMKQCLVELYSLDQAIAYQQAFVFIRQCAIHLRNATTGKSKEGYKAVYNWPFVHSLLLWQRMLCCLHPSDVLRPLIYPLVQVIIGTIGLMPIPMNAPLRFHLIKALIKLSDATDTFIPILPLLIKPLEQLDYKKKQQKSSSSSSEKKKLDFNCVLKVTKAQVHERTFSEATVKQVYELLLEYLSNKSNSIAFPELVFTSVLKIKSFVKDQCKSPDDSRLLKQALDKIEENVKFIESKRKGVSFKFNNLTEVDSWERECKEEGTPITKFYEKWRALKLENERKEVAKSIAGSKSGAKDKRKRGHDNSDDDDDEQDIDDEDDDGDQLVPEKTKKKSTLATQDEVNKKTNKNKKKKKLGQSARKALKQQKERLEKEAIEKQLQVEGLEMSSDED